MFYYTFNNNLIISNTTIDRDDFISIDEDWCKNYHGKIFVLTSMDCNISRRSFIVSNKNLLFLEKEDLNLLKSSYRNNRIIPE